MLASCATSQRRQPLPPWDQLHRGPSASSDYYWLSQLSMCEHPAVAIYAEIFFLHIFFSQCRQRPSCKGSPQPPPTINRWLFHSTLQVCASIYAAYSRQMSFIYRASCSHSSAPLPPFCSPQPLYFFPRSVLKPLAIVILCFAIFSRHKTSCTTSLQALTPFIEFFLL